MTKMTNAIRPPANLKIVSLPVFPADDVVGRVQAASLAGEMRVVLTGARIDPPIADEIVQQIQAEIPTEIVEKPASDIPLGVLLEAVRIKMYNENLSDLSIYDMLFEKRLNGVLFNMQDIQDFSLPDLLQVLKIKMFNESISDQTVYDQLFEARLVAAGQDVPPQPAPRAFKTRLRNWIRRKVGI